MAACSVALAVAAGAFWATPADATTNTYEGHALLKTDGLGRLAVVLDLAPADGSADVLFLYDPAVPLPPLVPFEADVTVQLDLEAGTLVVGGPDLSFDVNVVQSPRPAQSNLILAAHSFRSYGRALRSQFKEWNRGIHDVYTEGYPTVVTEDELDLETITCFTGMVTRDTDCTSGGPGASSVTKDCPGMLPGTRGESSGVTCNDGYYACGYCSFGVAYTVCRSEKCSVQLN